MLLRSRTAVAAVVAIAAALSLTLAVRAAGAREAPVPPPPQGAARPCSPEEVAQRLRRRPRRGAAVGTTSPIRPSRPRHTRSRSPRAAHGRSVGWPPLALSDTTPPQRSLHRRSVRAGPTRHAPRAGALAGVGPRRRSLLHARPDSGRLRENPRNRRGTRPGIEGPRRAQGDGLDTASVDIPFTPPAAAPESGSRPRRPSPLRCARARGTAAHSYSMQTTSSTRGHRRA